MLNKYIFTFLVCFIVIINLQTGLSQNGNQSSFAWFTPEFASNYALNEALLVDKNEIGFQYSKEPQLVAYTYNSNDELVLFSGLSVEYRDSNTKKEPVALRAYVLGNIYFELDVENDDRLCNYVPLEMFDSLRIGKPMTFLNYIKKIEVEQEDEHFFENQIVRQLKSEQGKSDPMIRIVLQWNEKEKNYNLVETNIFLNWKDVQAQDTLEAFVHKYQFEYTNYLTLKEFMTKSGMELYKLSDRSERRLNNRFSKRYGPVKRTLISKQSNLFSYLIETNGGYKVVPFKHNWFYSKFIKRNLPKLRRLKKLNSDDLIAISWLPNDFSKKYEAYLKLRKLKKISFDVKSTVNKEMFLFSLDEGMELNGDWELMNNEGNYIMANGSFLNGKRNGQWNVYLHPEKGKKCSMVYYENHIESEYGNCELKPYLDQLTQIKEGLQSLTVRINELPNALGWKRGYIETEASFPGGPEAMKKFISENLQYPENAIDLSIQGRVYLTFVVESDGSITNVAIERGVSTDLDKEAVRLLKSMPKWIPGTLHGKKTSSRCRLILTFTLN